MSDEPLYRELDFTVSIQASSIQAGRLGRHYLTTLDERNLHVPRKLEGYTPD